MSEFPSPETAKIFLSTVSGAVMGSFSRRSGSRKQWFIDLFFGCAMAFILGAAVISATGFDALAVYGILAFCGVPIANRIRRYAEQSKIGELPALEEEKEA